MAKASELDDVSLLKMFIALRDRRARRKADYNADDAGDKDKQSNIEIEFLKRFNERGIDNVSSNGVGTAYRSTRASATVGDWDALLEHIQKDDAWEMLERRVNKTAVLQYKEENADLPPGVNWSETQVINFRRK
jgi:predicted PolB exonuclease-like 3'-5' exonuclease